MKYYWLILFLVFGFQACKKKTSTRKISPAFYHWQTNLKINQTEKNYLDSLQVKTLYAKFFDVDWDNKRQAPEPQAQVILNQKNLTNLNIVPTIFITNRTLKHLPDSLVQQFADNIVTQIYLLAKQIPILKIKEVQIDCDWSLQTKIIYFELLHKIRQSLEQKGSKISATIRLHQIKYFQKTGVPPVDRGTLMFYNMGDLENVNTKNSILDLEIAKQYLINFDKYPLPLDLALPIFSWGVVIRDGKMIKLINQLSNTDLNDHTRFLKINEKRYQLIKSTYLDGYYLYKDDIIRLEDVSIEQLKNTAQLLSGVLKREDFHLIFYHLDDSTIKHFPHDNLETLIDILH